MRTGMLKGLTQPGRGSSEPPSLHRLQEASSEGPPSLRNVPAGCPALSLQPPPAEVPCAQLFHPLWPECLDALTKHLGPRESRELLQAAEEVAVGVGQVSVQLAEVAVPLPDHHLRGTGT